MPNSEHPIEKYLLKHIPKNSQGIVLMAMQHFSVSRTTVLRHLGYLVKSGQVIKTGVSKQTRYALKDSAEQYFQITCEPLFDEFEVFNRFVSSTIKAAVNKNAYDVAEYTVTEMLNNAKDHSRGRTITMSVELTAECLHIVIEDDGVGIFKKIQQECHFAEAREALFELTKGKLTSDPNNHTGEGVFFTSRMCNVFKLSANGFCYMRDNNINDWTFFQSDQKKGTCVDLMISRTKAIEIVPVFVSYQDEDSLAFNKTDILIDLAQNYGERLISRSQAQRVSRNLEKFERVTVDFKKVQAVGQGFVDQLFRVYLQQRSGFIIEYINANPEVEFMIQRGIKRT